MNRRQPLQSDQSRIVWPTATTLRGMLVESDALLDRKLHTHGAFCASMCYVGAVFGTALWLWDFATDPQGARHTFQLRLGYLALALVPMAFKYATNRRVQAAVMVCVIMAGEVLFVAILNRLDTGMQYGIGGFMFFMLMPLQLLTCFSWRVNVICTILAGALPHWLALLGFAPGFEHVRYAALIWPTVGVMSIVHLVSAKNYQDRFHLETALEAASNTDALTGLANRRHFMPTLEQEIRRARRFMHGVSVIMLDIDHFKLINDSHGHPTGDLTIRALGDICRTMSRETDVVARLGGEEFAILMPETDPSFANTLAERIRGAVAETQLSSLKGEPFRFTVSIGVAGLREGAHNAENLIDAADSALYRAKQGGRNQVVLGDLA
jgi:diguanylate cyclase (GGDEF)-like protein